MKADFTLVVAFDGSAEARRALHVALEFADAVGAGADVHAVSVVDYISLPGGLTQAPAGAPDLLASDAEAELRVADEIAAAAGRRITTRLLRGPVVSEILKYAQGIGATLILVGTHGRKGVARAVLGSTCESLVRRSEIPVLTVRAAAQPDAVEPRSGVDASRPVRVRA
ncbi:MAG TPA: universal stress protein [Candidatus Baltobacteraceae bacterium]|nr:universal stress protein [Candidatus Baltobacteraceae bacterium]